MEMTLGSNIRARRKALRITLETLSHAADWDTGNLSRLERGVQATTTPERLAKIAQVLGCTLPELYAEIGPNAEVLAATRQYMVPVVGYGRNGPFAETLTPFPEGSEYIPTDTPVSSDAFCLILKNNSNAPDYLEGDKVIIDPTVEPIPGDMVFAKNGEDEGTFKKYRPRGRDDQGQEIFELVPLNDDYPTLRSDRDGPMRIIGTMVEHRRFRRR